MPDDCRVTSQGLVVNSERDRWSLTDSDHQGPIRMGKKLPTEHETES